MLGKICMGLLMAVCPFMVANAAGDAAWPTHTLLEAAGLARQGPM